jgi:Gluconate 2-dehydrogenase subunit 3
MGLGGMNDQTRRNWVFTITRAAAGLGVAWTVQGDIAQPVSLPPGVYLPSTDHLSHALMSADRYHPIPPGCPTDYVRATNGPFKPVFFSGQEFSLIRRLTQLLLGEAAHDSAVSQEVAEWVDLTVSKEDGVHEAESRVNPLHRALAKAYYGSAETRHARTNSARVCRDGLEWISRTAQTRHSTGFLSLGEDQQIAILKSISDGPPDKQNENAGTRFFTLLKAEIINGFYTSRIGLQELDFKGNAFYASSPGCHSK